MQCPECQSTHIRKNGKKKGKQNHICVDCGRQFIEDYAPPQGYSDEVKRHCLKLYVNGLGFRVIERVTGVHHTTVIHWVEQVNRLLLDAYDPESCYCTTSSSGMFFFLFDSYPHSATPTLEIPTTHPARHGQCYRYGMKSDSLH